MNLLFSYAYIARMRRAWEFIRRASGGIDFLLDSGAHSAWNLGTHIDLGSYVDCCQRNAEYLWDYVVLDVVADKRSTLRNLATMRRAGLRPMTVLTSDMSMRLMPRLSADGCRVAIAGGVTETMKWYGPRIKAAQAAAPGTQLHGLGFSRGLPVATTPVHSVDSSTYKEGGRFGTLTVWDRTMGLVRYTSSKLRTRPPSKWPRQLRTLLVECGMPGLGTRKHSGLLSPLYLLSLAAWLRYAAWLRARGIRYFFALANAHEALPLFAAARHWQNGTGIDWQACRQDLPKLRRLITAPDGERGIALYALEAAAHYREEADKWEPVSGSKRSS